MSSYENLDPAMRPLVKVVKSVSAEPSPVGGAKRKADAPREASPPMGKWVLVRWRGLWTLPAQSSKVAIGPLS